MTHLRSMSNRVGRGLAIFLLSLTLSALSSATINAQPASAPPASPAQSAVTVSPGRLNLILDKSSAVSSQTVTITNSYTVDLRVNAAFQGIDEAANLLVPMGEVSRDLAPALKLSETDIIIPARGSKTLVVQVSDVPSLRAGGHYATLVVTPLAQSEALTPPTRTVGGSSVRSVISISLFIIKQADTVAADVVVDTIGYERRLFGLPTIANLKLTNAGNVHAVPRAIVRLIRPGGQTVLSQGVANQNSQLLRPGKQLTDRIALRPLVALAGAWKPQRLQLQVQYRVDGATALRTVSRTVWYVPTAYLVALPVLLAATWVVWWTMAKAARRKLQ